MDNNLLVPIIVALITATPATLVALLTLRRTKENKEAIQDVHVSINSRMDELLKSTKASSFAQGQESGRKERA